MKRPKGWDERYLEAYKKEYLGKGYGSPERAMFEAGADAMLEGLLKQEGFQCYVHGQPGITIVIPKPPMLPNGYLVFIPDEEVE